MQSFRDALAALKAGEVVGLFPEATISRSFEPKEFKTGAERLAKATKAPLIPVGVWGTQRLWTYDEHVHAQAARGRGQRLRRRTDRGVA